MEIYKKSLEEALKESEEKFKSLFYNSPEALVYLDKNGNILDINPKFTELFGYELNEIKGKNLNSGIIHPENLLNEGRKLDEIALKTGYVNVETIRKRKDGTTFPASVSSSSIIINGEVKGIIGLYIDLTERKKHEEMLRYLAMHDSLTGLPNKILLQDKFQIEKVRYDRYKNKFAVLFVDLYEFKFINDYYGHKLGDEVLKIISDMLQSNIRKSDLISRIGGDEFVILATDLTDIKNVTIIADKIITSFLEPIKVNDKEFSIGINIGIAIYPDDGNELDDLIKKADFAMYYAKNIGKNKFSFYNEDILKGRLEELKNIRKNNYRYDSIFNYSPHGMILLDNQRTVFFANNKFLEILELKKHEVLGKNIEEIFNENDFNIDRYQLDKFFKGEFDELDIEIPYIKKDGDKIYLKINFYNFKDKQMDVNYIFLTLFDITKEKILNHSIKKEKEFLKKILDNLHSIVVLEDLNGNVLMINKKGCEILGYNEDEIVGKNWIEQFTPDYYKEELKKLYFELKNGEIDKYKFHENPVKTKNGEERMILWKNSYIEEDNGNIINILSSGLDITENLQIRNKLKESEELLRKVFDVSDEIIFIKDLDGTYINANKAFSEIFDRPLNEIIGKKDDEIFTKEEAEYLREVDEKIIETKKHQTTEDRLIVNGEEFIFNATKSPIFDENGNVISICGFAKNITPLKEREKEKEELIISLKNELYYQQSIKKISDILNSFRDLNSLFKVILDEVDRIVPSTSSNIALIEGSVLKNMAVRGYEKYGVEDFVKNFKKNINEFPLLKEVILNKKPIIINDTYKNDRWVILKETKFIKSHMIIPIIVGDEVIGVLGLDYDKENVFSVSDMEKLTILSNTLGITIDNIRLIEKLQETSEQVILLITKISEFRDPYTTGHQKNVAEIAVKIAQKMKLSYEQIELIRYASLLHDVGKMLLPIELLMKPAKLSSIEFEIIKEHTKIGYNLIKDIDFPYPIKEIILQHHERLDGSGYPSGLKKDEIIFEAKIVSVADVIDAMSSHRPYRPAHKMDDVIDELVKNADILYDKDVVNAFIETYNEKNSNKIN
ncbi:MAG TPA: PAS domain S-box protein [Caldisericia bacterium]|nr:PAS domain S-box protein [Caldisericia bacterium]